MDEAILRFRVGVFVVLALLILGVLIFLNSEGWTRKYTIYVKSWTAPGVTRSTPVRKNGILIGRVGSVQTQDDHVIMTLEINEGQYVYENETCSIGADSFLGDSAIEILPLRGDDRGEMITAGNLMTRVSVKRNPLEIVDVALNLEGEITRTLETVREAGSAVTNAGQGIQTLTNQVSGALSDDESDFKLLLSDIRAMSQKAKVALDNFDRMFENINNVVGDPDLKKEVKNAISTLPEVFKEVRLTIADTRETINSYREVSRKATSNLDNLEGFTASLKKEGPEILEKVNSSLANVSGLMDRVGKFADTLSKISEDLSSSDGTIGKLLNDPALYNSALGTAEEARQTVSTIRKSVDELSIRLEPLVNDLRMFADSLARDPRQLGIKGALDARPSGSGYKGNAAGRERVMRR